MVSVVTLIGRPNVGESTLFNRLTHARDTLVADLPGLTRNRKYGRAEVEGRELICIDADGIDGTEGGVETRMAGQSLLATEEADIVLFMVDARVGLMSTDGAIAKHLCSRQKPTFPVVNRTNEFDPDQTIVDFYSLGLSEIYPITAPRDRGVLSLLEHVLLPWMDDITPQEEVGEGAECWVQLEARENGEKEPKDDFNLQDLPIKLAIIGRPNAGKSMLTNHILGKDRVVVYNMPGVARDGIYVPIQHDEREHMLINTAGVREHDKITEAIGRFSVIRTLQAIENASVVILVISVREGTSDQDLSLLGFILNNERSFVIVVNRQDGLMQEVGEQVKETLDFRLSFIGFACIHSISALHDSGVGNLFESVREVCGNSTRHAGTAMLTCITTIAVEGRQPPLAHGRRARLKYAHVGDYDPSIVVIRGNQVKNLPDSYERYLTNHFRKSLGAMEALIRTQFKKGENLFASERNALTPAQMCKRKRLIRHIEKSK